MIDVSPGTGFNVPVEVAAADRFFLADGHGIMRSVRSLNRVGNSERLTPFFGGPSHYTNPCRRLTPTGPGLHPGETGPFSLARRPPFLRPFPDCQTPKNSDNGYRRAQAASEGAGSGEVCKALSVGSGSACQAHDRHSNPWETA